MTARVGALLSLGALTALAGCGDGGDPGPAPDFATPESVLHDPDQDVYFVSNVNGGAVDKDGNGFVLRVRPDTMARERFVSGDQTGVTLHAPKGMALVDDVLWVADIDALRRFDRRSGAPMGSVEIPGATFLNDVTAGPDGSVYCTDSGLDGAFAATGTDAIWRVAPSGEVTALARGEELGQPNGIVAVDAGLYVVGWRDGVFYQLDYRGNRTALATAPQGQLDGLVRVELEGPNGRSAPVWFATSWAGRTVYRFGLTGGCAPLPLRLEQPADLTWDSKRKALVVPLFGADRLHVESL